MKHCLWCFEPLINKSYSSRFCTRNHSTQYRRNKLRSVMYQKGLDLLGNAGLSFKNNLNTYLENRQALISYVKRLGFKWDAKNQNWIPTKRLKPEFFNRLQSG